MSTTLTFRKTGIEYIEYLTHGLSLAAIETYAGNIAQYSNAGIVEVTYTLGTEMTLAQSIGDYPSIELYAKVFLRDAATHKLYAAIIRAPKISMFEPVFNSGWRVKKTVGQQIAAYYSTLSGLTFQFDHGGLCGNE